VLGVGGGGWGGGGVGGVGGGVGGRGGRGGVGNAWGGVGWCGWCVLGWSGGMVGNGGLWVRFWSLLDLLFFLWLGCGLEVGDWSGVGYACPVDVVIMDFLGGRGWLSVFWFWWVSLPWERWGLPVVVVGLRARGVFVEGWVVCVLGGWWCWCC
jgi:hypothetical protein